MRPVDAVIEFLEAEQARGKSHVLLDEHARAGLRRLHQVTKGDRTTTHSAPATPAPTSTARLDTTAHHEPGQPSIPHLLVTGTTKQQQLDSLRQQAEAWPPAKTMGSLRDIMVFASGNPDARLMLIGEAPGHEEERKREPFVGPAGQKLNDILKAMGLSRDDVYISNIVKFRPATPRQTTNNRKPSPEEMAACLPFIREEIRIIQPTCIVALGGTAAEGLLDRTASVTALRGSWHTFEGIPLRATYHPSYLLRSTDHTTKRQVWEDMLAVMEKLELPISEKQRGYFLPKPNQPPAQG